MRLFIALATLVVGLSFAGTPAQAADCCSGGKCGTTCTKCGSHCSPQTCCK